MNVFKLIEDNGLTLHGDIEHFAELIRQEEREKVAAWMMRQGYATGHGDTVEDLLKELEWQIREREREACAKVCAKVCEDIPLPKDSEALTHLPTIERCAAAIRARGMRHERLPRR